MVVMFVRFLIFQHASISLFPEEPQTMSRTTPSQDWEKAALFVFKCYSQTAATPAEELVQSPPVVTGYRQLTYKNFKFPNSSVDEEGADNHPHSSAPPSPHPQDLSPPQHHSEVVTRMRFLDVGLKHFYGLWDPAWVNLWIYVIIIS